VKEGIITLGIKDKEPLVEENLDRLPSRAVNHELGAGLAEDGRSIVDELAGISLYSQVDAALRVRRRAALRDRYGLSATLFRGWRMTF
jgi:hypothetical protein